MFWGCCCYFFPCGRSCLATTGYRQERLLWLLQGQQSRACLPGVQQTSPCASCAGHAPSPDNGAIHHRCLQERVCSEVVQHFLAAAAAVTSAWFVPAAAGMDRARHGRYVLAPPEGWAGAAGSSPRLQLGTRERGTQCWLQLLCSEPKDLAWTSPRWEIRS